MAVAVQKMRVLDLWDAALSADSATQLDIRRFVAEPNPVWDVEAAAEMWWRASALEALQVCRRSLLLLSDSSL